MIRVGALTMLKIVCSFRKELHTAQRKGNWEGSSGEQVLALLKIRRLIDLEPEPTSFWCRVKLQLQRSRD